MSCDLLLPASLSFLSDLSFQKPVKSARHRAQSSFGYQTYLETQEGRTKEASGSVGAPRLSSRSLHSTVGQETLPILPALLECFVICLVG